MNTQNVKPLAIQNYVYSQYKRCAAKRGFAFNLSIELFLEIASKPCVYCTACSTNTARRAQYTINEWSYNGVDRVNSALPYEVGNVVACCKACNAAKSDMDHAVFVASDWLRARVAMIRGE